MTAEGVRRRLIERRIALQYVPKFNITPDR